MEQIYKNKTTRGTDVLSRYLSGRAVGIRINSIYKSFADNKVLRGLNLEVKPGETLVILGKSGSGKSVLLRHIAGLLKPDSGNIMINGNDINTENHIKDYSIAMVFQSSALFNSLTVEENISLYLREHKVFENEHDISLLVASCLEIVDLPGKENALPSELSGGMKKRVAVARGLAMNPDLILFDEPTAGLDPMTTDTIGELINKLRHGIKVTQIVVTHDIEFASEISDRIAVLDNGKIVAVSTYEELVRSTVPEIRQFFS